MPLLLPFLLGIAFLGAGLALGRWLVSADPRRVARIIRLLGGSVGVTAGLGLVLARQPMFGFMLMSGAGGLLLAELRRPPPAVGSAGVSEVETYLLRFTLDQATGLSEGEILGGDYAGRLLSSLSQAEFDRFHDQCLTEDPDAVGLLNAWLAAQGRSSGRGGAGADRPMTEAEAAAILGVPLDASPAAIQAAYRRVIARAHPDKGGTDWLAARVNAARELLLRRRR
jgi:hypothetical protein